MQIALTKKLANTIGVNPAPNNNDVSALFSWTANWTNTFYERKEDMIVMVNNATQFTVLIYGIKHNQFKNITMKMTDAIRNTLLTMNINTEVMDEYMRQAGEAEFITNHDRKLTACVNRRGVEASYIVGNIINESEIILKYDDTLGRIVSRNFVNHRNNYRDCDIPYLDMIKALTELTRKPAYKYRAFELLVCLDLEIYKAMRRLIVPADIEFSDLHKVLQRVFNWENYHLHYFNVVGVV